jgi:hypothetical protein
VPCGADLGSDAARLRKLPYPDRLAERDLPAPPEGGDTSAERPAHPRSFVYTSPLNLSPVVARAWGAGPRMPEDGALRAQLGIAGFAPGVTVKPRSNDAQHEV